MADLIEFPTRRRARLEHTHLTAALDCQIDFLELLKNSLGKIPQGNPRSDSPTPARLPDQFRGSGHCLACGVRFDKICSDKFQFCDEECLTDFSLQFEGDDRLLSRQVALVQRRYETREDGSSFCRW